MRANSGFRQTPNGLFVPSSAWLDALELQGIPRRVAIAASIQNTLAGSSETPASGGTIATHTVGGKEHQVMMAADISGHIWGSKPQYYALIPSQVHLAAASGVHWDIFNAAALIVRLLTILQIPNVTTAVTGIVFDWLLERSTSIGTAGAAITPWQADLSDTALDANITCRSKPTGGAAAGIDLRNYSISSEETAAATLQMASQGGLELVPDPLRPINGGKGIVLRQNQGVRCVQVTNSNAGNTGWLIGFSVE